MLIDTADDTAALPDDTVAVMSGNNNNNNNHDDTDDDDYSIISRASSDRVNLEGDSKSLLLPLPLPSSTTIIEDWNGTDLLDESKLIVSVSKPPEETPRISSIITSIDDEDCENEDHSFDKICIEEFAVVKNDDHTFDNASLIAQGHDHHQKKEVDDRVVSLERTETRKIMPGIVERVSSTSGFACFLTIFFVILLSGVVDQYTQQVQTLHAQVRLLRDEIQLFQEKEQTQYFRIIQLTDEIRRLENDKGTVQIQHHDDIAACQQEVDEMQVTISSTADQKETIQTLQEQVHQLCEEASTMELKTTQELRRCKRRYREFKIECTKCNDIDVTHKQSMDELSNNYEYCTIRKQQLKKSLKEVKTELRQVTGKLRNTTTDLRESTKEVKRQTTMIAKMQKHVSDLKMKESEARKKKKEQRTNKENEKFSWDEFKYRKSGKSYHVDNCWMYLEATMDFGECVYNRADDANEYFQRMRRQFFKGHRSHNHSDDKKQHHNKHQQQPHQSEQ